MGGDVGVIDAARVTNEQLADELRALALELEDEWTAPRTLELLELAASRLGDYTIAGAIRRRQEEGRR